MLALPNSFLILLRQKYLAETMYTDLNYSDIVECEYDEKRHLIKILEITPKDSYEAFYHVERCSFIYSDLDSGLSLEDWQQFNIGDQKTVPRLEITFVWYA